MYEPCRVQMGERPLARRYCLVGVTTKADCSQSLQHNGIRIAVSLPCKGTRHGQAAPGRRVVRDRQAGAPQSESANRIRSRPRPLPKPRHDASAN